MSQADILSRLPSNDGGLTVIQPERVVYLSSTISLARAKADDS